MYTWSVVDEFGFVVEMGFIKKEDAEKSRKEWESTEIAKEWDLKYEIQRMPV